MVTWAGSPVPGLSVTGVAWTLSLLQADAVFIALPCLCPQPLSLSVSSLVTQWNLLCDPRKVPSSLPLSLLFCTSEMDLLPVALRVFMQMKGLVQCLCWVLPLVRLQPRLCSSEGCEPAGWFRPPGGGPKILAGKLKSKTRLGQGQQRRPGGSAHGHGALYKDQVLAAVV